MGWLFSLVEELTEDEQRDCLYLECKVERAFYEAGKALQSLRDRRLYRSAHKILRNARIGLGLSVAILINLI